MVQDYILENFQGTRRRKRESRYLTGNENRKSHYEVIPIQTLPLIKRVFNIDELHNLPNFETQPIRDPALLREIGHWNVSNHDFSRRIRLYVAENMRISVLRTIRYCEYRFRQLSWSQTIKSKRPLNYAEFSTLQDVENGRI